jgi:hypothetical protein
MLVARGKKRCFNLIAFSSRNIFATTSLKHQCHIKLLCFTIVIRKTLFCFFTKKILQQVAAQQYLNSAI